MQAYRVAIASFEQRDLAEGVRMLIAGEISEHDGRYAPTAPQLARAARKALDKRLDAQIDRRPRLPPPDVVKTPESQARVKQMLAGLVSKIEDKSLPNTEAKKRRAGFQARLDERFPSVLNAPKQSFSVGHESDD